MHGNSKLSEMVTALVRLAGADGMTFDALGPLALTVLRQYGFRTAQEAEAEVLRRGVTAKWLYGSNLLEALDAAEQYQQRRAA